MLRFPTCLCLEHSRCYFIDEIPHGWPPYPHINTGYRVNLGWLRSFLSIFQTSHNEFWYIWTDIIPLLIFIIISIYHVNTVRFKYADYKLQLLEVGVLFGITICRGTSLLYHTFNCVNLWTSQHLIQVDLIGIAATCLVSPYFYIIGSNSSDVVIDKGFTTYCTILFTVQGLATIMFLSNMIIGVSRVSNLLEQPLLCGLAVFGNYSGIRLLINSEMSITLRIHCLVSISSLVIGYIVFFIFKFPERYYPAGTSDGRIWNSHSLWHLILFIGQLSLLTVPVLYS